MTHSSRSSSERHSSLMRAVVGLSALALGAASSPTLAPTTMLGSSSLYRSSASGSCGLGGACRADATATIMDIKTARAMVAAEVDMEGRMLSENVGNEHP